MPVVTGTNPAFDDCFDREDPIGRPLPAVVETGERPRDVIDRWLRSGGDGIEIHAADGRTFLFQLVVAGRERGEAEGYGIYTDIT